MDVLRARAYLDLLLGHDSRPARETPGGQDGAGRRDPRDGGPGAAGGGPGAGGGGPGGPAAGPVPAGFAGTVTLTVPLTTVQDQAGRPGDRPGRPESRSKYIGSLPNPGLIAEYAGACMYD